MCFLYFRMPRSAISASWHPQLVRYSVESHEIQYHHQKQDLRHHIVSKLSAEEFYVGRGYYKTLSDLRQKVCKPISYVADFVSAVTCQI